MFRHSCFAAVLILTVAVACAAQNSPTFSVAFKELESYEKSKVTWRNIVVDKKIKREDLIKLARELHSAHPTARFRIFTDDEKFQQFMQRDIHYPDPAYTYPEAWAKKHYVAIINRMLTMDGPVARWQLYAMSAGMKYVVGDTSVIAELEK